MIIRACVLAAALVLVAWPGRADEVNVNSAFMVMERGGMLMWAILASSMVGCAFIAERLLAIRRNKQIPKRLMAQLRDAMVSGGVTAGIRVVENDKSAMGKVMYALLSRSGATRRELENTVDDEASRILTDLRANLKPIGVMAVVSPQLGLLGTVFGLIGAFRAAAELGMDDPRNFAAGIYEALYTTAFGLVVAIPLLIAYHALRNRADALMREVEIRSLAFISAASSRAETQRAGGRPGSSAYAPGPETADEAETEFAAHIRSGRHAAEEETSKVVDV